MFPPTRGILLFALATTGDARPFFAERWPEVPVVCEASGRFHRDLLGAARAGVRDLLRPRVWARVLAARRKGHRQGRARADVWRLGGAMLVTGQQVVWRHAATDVSEHFDLTDPELLRALRSAGTKAR
ncbi:MAG: hypothetical protein R3F56_17345 [Planctomycetota bacterium]